MRRNTGCFFKSYFVRNNFNDFTLRAFESGERNMVHNSHFHLQSVSPTLRRYSIICLDIGERKLAYSETLDIFTILYPIITGISPKLIFDLIPLFWCAWPTVRRTMVGNGLTDGHGQFRNICIFRVSFCWKLMKCFELGRKKYLVAHLVFIIVRRIGSF